MSVKRRIVRAGGWGLVKRLIKPVPVIGSIFALGLAAYEIRKKGLIPGAIHVGLDITPVVGTAKNVVEIFTGDLIPDKKVNGSESVASQDGKLLRNKSELAASPAHN
jgi:hypothetical protein